jgi:hypothetical protein
MMVQRIHSSDNSEFSDGIFSFPLPSKTQSSLNKPVSAANSKRKNKALKTRQSRPSYVLGKDVALYRMSSLATKALVGKFYYIKMTKARLKKWISTEWKQVLGYCPRFSLLSNFWIIFHFLSEEDLNKVSKKTWVIDRGVLMMKKREPGPHTEGFSKRCLWMLLPELPIEYLDLEVLRGLRDSVGRFVYFDERDLKWNNKRMAWVLVEVDLDLGLPEDIEICT